MTKILVSLPDKVFSRMKALVPDRQRSRFISQLVEEALKQREEELFRLAREVEQDQTLREEQQAWDATAADGVDNEPW